MRAPSGLPGEPAPAGRLVAVGLCLAGPIGAATTERIVVDRNSGLAISGFDPVAYFTDAKPLPGKGEYEQAVAGAVWRFRSAGNRAAFKADPDVYMPRFGGYDPVGVARGVAVPGNPHALGHQRRTALSLLFGGDAGRNSPATATAPSQPPTGDGRLFFVKLVP